MADGRLQTLERGLDILSHCARGDRAGCSIEDIVEQLDLPRSTAYRMVKALKERGFLRAGERKGRLQLGYQLVQLAQAADTSSELSQAALPVLQQIVESFEETAFITVRSGWQALCLEQIESPHPIRLSYRKGRTLPLYAGGSAKVLLAHLSPRDQDRVLGGEIEIYRDPALADPAKIRRTLKDIRRRGYATSREEIDPGVLAICVPILGANDRLIGGLTLAGPKGRMPSGAEIPGVARYLRSAGARIAEDYQRRCGA